MIDSDIKLWVHSIFESISGEAGGIPQGTWVTIVRLQGCNLDCSWCDAKEAAEIWMDRERALSVEEIVGEVGRLRNRHVLITGGEPLLQTGLMELLDRLSKQGYIIQVETNGSMIIPYFRKIHWVMDYKCPSSNMTLEMLPVEVIGCMLKEQQDGGGSIVVKFVIADDQDLKCATEVMLGLDDCGYLGNFLLSPINADPKILTSIPAMIKYRCPDLLWRTILSIQVHKLVGLS